MHTYTHAHIHPCTQGDGRTYLVLKFTPAACERMRQIQQVAMGVAMGVALGVAGTATGVVAAAVIAVASGRLKCRCRGFERKHVYATMEAEPGSSLTAGHFRRPGPPVILEGEAAAAASVEARPAATMMHPDKLATEAAGEKAGNESFHVQQQETSVEQVTVL